jgi:hypothetical protein
MSNVKVTIGPTPLHALDKVDHAKRRPLSGYPEAMPRRRPQLGELFDDLEGQLAGAGIPMPLSSLLRAAEGVRRIRQEGLDSPEDMAPFTDRLDNLSARLSSRLSDFRQSIVDELLNLEIELRPKQERRDRLRSALAEICRAQDEPRIRFEAPNLDGHVLAVERHSVTLPKAESTAREELDAAVRAKPEYWIEASILRADRLLDVCDRVAATDPEFEAAIRPMLQYSREFTIFLRSKRLKDQPEAEE